MVRSSGSGAVRMTNPQFVKFRKPVRVDNHRTNSLRKLLKAKNIQVPNGFSIWSTDTKKGRCSYRSGTLTVPIWVLDRGMDYTLWYACHEIAHTMAIATKGNHHGPEFMAALISICPEDFLHHELNYKPRLAAAAGITQKEANK